MEGQCKQVGDIEEEGGRKIGMPIAHNNDNRDALLGVEEGLGDAMNASKIIDLRPLSHSLLSALLNINISVLCAM